MVGEYMGMLEDVFQTEINQYFFLIKGRGYPWSFDFEDGVNFKVYVYYFGRKEYLLTAVPTYNKTPAGFKFIEKDKAEARRKLMLDVEGEEIKRIFLKGGMHH